MPGFVSQIETYWEEPTWAKWLERLGNFSRVALFDKRGTGLSDRGVAVPDMDKRMDDIRAVRGYLYESGRHAVAGENTFGKSATSRQGGINITF